MPKFVFCFFFLFVFVIRKRKNWKHKPNGFGLHNIRRNQLNLMEVKKWEGTDLKVDT